MEKYLKETLGVKSLVIGTNDHACFYSGDAAAEDYF